MNITIIYLLMLIVAYIVGCLSSSIIIAKSFRNLNIYKVGTGIPDTENIFMNVSKSLGILVGLIDLGKMYLFLFLSNFILNLDYFNIGRETNQNLLLLIGFVLIVGHCFPAFYKFNGGRGMFSYIGFVLFFAPFPMLLIGIISIFIIFKFKQIRFAKFMIVLLPPLLNFIPFLNDTNYSPAFIGKMFFAAIVIGLLNILVSKKMGEF